MSRPVRFRSTNPIMNWKHASCPDAGDLDSTPEVRHGNSTHAASPPTPETPQPYRSTVLLVEDEPMLAEVFRRILAGAGFGVLACRTAMDALLVLEADALRVDVVLSDVRLPVITGDRLAQDIRRIRPDLPVLLMTGFSATVTPENAHALGVAAVLQKPLPARLLVSAIQEALRGAAQAGSASRSSPAVRHLEVAS